MPDRVDREVWRFKSGEEFPADKIVVPERTGAK